MNHILRNILMRRSTSQFDSRPIQDADLMDILEEGKVLSNAANNQEWHFTVMENRSVLQRLHELYVQFVTEQQGDNSLMAPAHLLLDAPVAIIISGRKETQFVEDAANTVFGSMMLVAEKAGVGACWLSSASALFEMEDGKTFLKDISVPEGYVPLCMGAFGYKRTSTGVNVLSSEDHVVNIIK